ncbi:hypothetical protein [Rasiella sp. SM2506]|uniref:hypothetical protein n=1 Tax=Rasiella sp. SM2506 TaxID=3423914 RepID=UPI003D7AAB45
MFSSIKNNILLLLCGICILSCAETNKKSANTAYVDVMISEVLTDEAIKESWELLTNGQQLADEGESIEHIVKTFPLGTIFQTNHTSIRFFIKGSISMIIELDRHNKNKGLTKGGSNVNRTSQSLPLMNINANLSNFNIIDNSKENVDVVGSDRNDNERQQKKALILAPYNSTDFKNYDDADVAYKYLKKNRNYKDNIKFLKDNNITLDDFASFAEYDLVHLSTHGENFCEIKIMEDNSWVLMDPNNVRKCNLTISTNIQHWFTENEKDIPEEIKELYKKYGEFIDISDNEILLKNSFFFNFYKSGLKNKIWIFSACQLGSNNYFEITMDDIHTNGHFFYWLNSVMGSDAERAFNEFYDNLIMYGLDAAKSFEKIPTVLRENIPQVDIDTFKVVVDTVYKIDPKTKEKLSELVYKDSIAKKNYTTSLLHLQTGDPRHGIEVIDMLNPTNNSLVQAGDFYKLVGEFDDGKDEALTLKVKLIGYTKAEFLEEKMNISLLVDDENVLSKQSFLPDVSGDNSTLESIKDHKYGVIVTFTDIAIPDVGTKEELTLKAILHLNDEHISIHKETVSILSYGIIATTERRGRKSKFTYDGRRKTGKYELGSLPVVYHDDEGYKYINSRTSGWKKVNMRKMTGTNSNFDARTRTLLNFPLVGYALIFKMSDIQKVSEYSETKVECGLPAKCTQFSASNGVKLLYNGSGRLIEYTTPSQTINFQYGNYNVILPEAGIPKKVKKLEDVMSGTEAVQK